MHKLHILGSMMKPKQVQRVLPTTTHTNLHPATISTTVTTTVTPQRMSETSTNNDDRYDVQWEVVHYNKLPQDGQNFFSKVGNTYINKTELPPVA